MKISKTVLVTEDVDVRSCPFCGHSGITPEVQLVPSGKHHYLRCEWCGCHMYSSDTIEEAIEKWNRRAK